MVIVRLWGGLGNQMFQYACGYAVARRNNTNLALDTRFFTKEFIEKNPHFTKQRLNIIDFPLKYNEQLNVNGELQFISFLQNRTVSRIIRIPKRFCIHTDGLLYEKETRLSFLPYILNNNSANIYLDGYWQCEKYFLDYKEELKEQFSTNSVVARNYAEATGILNSNSVAVHLRLGDYVNKKKKSARYNYIINPNYYVLAINEIRKSLPDAKFYIFSNDMKKARKLLGDSSEFQYMNENRQLTDIEEFEVMSLCENHIISNSTFSWWALWLSDEKDGIKIAPDVFFGNYDIIPEGWIKIKPE